MANRSMEPSQKKNGNHHIGRGKVPQPTLGQRSREVQPYGVLVRYPLGLGDDVCAQSVEDLNQTLADT